jgi:CspA family cold shock protein
MRGKVKAIKRDKGYGFVTGEDGLDRFFHANHLEDVDFAELQEGNAVEFEPYTEEKKGERARRVKVVK